MSDQEAIELTLELVHETDDAWCVTDGTVTVWLPKSLTERGDDPRSFIVPNWLAEEKGLV